MDGAKFSAETEREIEALMQDSGMDRLAAMVSLGLHPGWSLPGSDVVSVRPMTEEQLRAFGLGRDFDEVMAAQRARRARSVETKTVDD